MDDSERSYGYSRDIYHGRRGPGGHYGTGYDGNEGRPFYPGVAHHEGSYEYGAEEGMGGDPHPEDFGPEEAAVRIRPSRRRGLRRRVGGAMGDSGVAPGSESWTWDVEGPHRGRGPRGYRRADDRIHEDVCDRLQHHGRLDASDVEVSVEGGEVTLSGTVPDRTTKRIAEAVAETVRGVVDIHNRLTLADRGERTERERAATRSEAARRANVGRTQEERSEAARKASATRKRRAEAGRASEEA